MYFNVSQLLKETSGSTRSYAVDDALLLMDNAPAHRVAGTVDMLRTDKGIWVSASLDTEVHCSCSRCLEEFDQPVHMNIEEEYLPEIDVNSGARLYYPDEFDENFYIDHNHTLDLSEAVRQYLSLNTPMKPICQQNCKGICLTCGANLNETACVCDNTPVDPRWSTLLELVSARDRDN
jgi:uncharacterized protein